MPAREEGYNSRSARRLPLNVRRRRRRNAHFLAVDRFLVDQSGYEDLLPEWLRVYIFPCCSSVSGGAAKEERESSFSASRFLLLERSCLSLPSTDLSNSS
jgi:hypothetical protein